MPRLTKKAVALYAWALLGLWLIATPVYSQEECSNQLDIDACNSLCGAAGGVCDAVCGAAEDTCKTGCSAASGACSGLCGAAEDTCTSTCIAADCTLDTLGCAVIDCCAGFCTGSDECQSCFDGCGESCENSCSAGCDSCELDCESDCSTDCTGCELECEDTCQDLCIPYGLAGETCVPLIVPCTDGLECRLVPALPGESEAFVCMPSEDENLADDDQCRSFYSRDIHETSMDPDFNLTLSLGVGVDVAAVVGATLETGIVYGNDGCYGCYITECLGVQTNVGVEAFAAVGFYTSYTDFQGESFVIVEQAGEGISFSTSQIFNTEGVFIGTADALSIGVSLLPISAGVYDCVTTTDTVGCIEEAGGDLIEVTNNPPNAVCAAATVCASGPTSCNANASINGGSFDVDGDTLILTQNPPQPYAIGSRSVTLTALDQNGASDSCSANVTVNDCEAPGVTCPGAVTVECQSNSQASATLSSPSAVDCSSVSFGDNQRSSYPLGSTTVTFTGTDSFSNAASCSTSVSVVDTTQPSITCPANMNITSNPGQCAVNRTFDVSSTDSCDIAPEISCVDQSGAAVDPMGNSYPVGTTLVTCTSRDDSSNSAQCNFNVAVNDPPIITVSPATQTVQYSDLIADVTLTGTDCGDADLTIIDDGFPAGTATGSANCGPDNGGRKCIWTLSGALAEPENNYSTIVKVNDGALDSAPKTVAISVKSENSVVAFDVANPVSIRVASDGGNSEVFSLMVHVKETIPDIAAPGAALPGDISRAVVSMSLIPVGPGGSVGGTCTPDTTDITGTSYDDELHVTCTFDDVPVNTYGVQVTVNSTGYYTGSNEDVLVIYDPSLGFTTGGFTFDWPGTNDRTTGGYTMKYNKKQTKVQGSLLLIRHLPDGSKYRIKSNALFGLALGGGGSFGWASFSGKSTYLEPGWLDAKGNHIFVAYVEDHDDSDASGDRFWLEVKDKNGNILPGLSMDRPAIDNAERLRNGNIIVPHTVGKR